MQKISLDNRRIIILFILIIVGGLIMAYVVVPAYYKSKFCPTVSETKEYAGCSVEYQYQVVSEDRDCIPCLEQMGMDCPEGFGEDAKLRLMKCLCEKEDYVSAAAFIVEYVPGYLRNMGKEGDINTTPERGNEYCQDLYLLMKYG